VRAVPEPVEEDNDDGMHAGIVPLQAMLLPFWVASTEPERALGGAKV
jgi:hypothetical protein